MKIEYRRLNFGGDDWRFTMPIPHKKSNRLTYRWFDAEKSLLAVNPLATYDFHEAVEWDLQKLIRVIFLAKKIVNGPGNFTGAGYA